MGSKEIKNIAHNYDIDQYPDGLDFKRRSVSPVRKIESIDLPEIDLKKQIKEQEDKSPYLPKRPKFHTLNYQ